MADRYRQAQDQLERLRRAYDAVTLTSRRGSVSGDRYYRINCTSGVKPYFSDAVGLGTTAPDAIADAYAHAGRVL